MDFLEKIVFKNCTNDNFLYEYLLSHGASQTTVPPTDFMEEMQLTTEERLQKIKKKYLKSKTHKPPRFDIIPNVIIFQNFKPGEIQTITLSIINTSKVPVCLTIHFTHSPYFSMAYKDSVPDKLAPGMELQCLVNFKPESYKDYLHKMKIITSDKEYVIPIIGAGPRALLTLPDEVTIPTSLVNLGSEKILLVKNVGQTPGIFTLHTELPFSVKPASGILKPNESMQIIVRFKSEDECLRKGQILVRFDSGEILRVDVKSKSESADITISEDCLQFDDTYMGLRCQKILQMHNNSKHVVKYYWKKHNSNIQDKIEGDKIKEKLVVVQEHEMKKSTKLETYDVVDNDINNVIYKRILNDELIDFDNDEQFLYNDTNFFVMPISGEIYPNQTVDVSAVFSPKNVSFCESTAFCKIAGKVDRLSINLCGYGIGPKFSFNVENIDLSDIYVYTDVNFEIVIHNKGDISGQVSFVTKRYDFGTEITCKPNSIYLKPFENGAFLIKLKANTDGSFIEELYFVIDESGEQTRVIVKGCAKYAQLTVEKRSMNFGLVSVGLKEISYVTVYNKTRVDIPFVCFAKVIEKERTSQFESSGVLPTVTKIAEEFNFVPNQDVIPSFGKLDIKVELTPVECVTKKTEFCLDAYNIPKNRVIVYMCYEAGIPEVVCDPNEINIRFCFVNYLCQRLITFENRSFLSGNMKIYVEPHDALELATSITECFIQPYQSTDVVVDIICKETGKQESQIKVSLFGATPYTACTVICIGQGPIILFVPEKLNFGEVTLLKNTTKTATVYNDSPVPVNITVETKAKSPWSVNPKVFFLNPEESIDVEVTVYLNDFRKYKGKIIFNVENRGPLEYFVTAKGVGTAIAIEPLLTPVLDLKSQLTQNLITRTFKVTNMGVRFHKILISHNLEVKSFQSYNSELDSEFIFKIEPYLLQLKPKESCEIVITGQEMEVKYVEEPLYFHAVIEKVDRKEIIVDSKIIANFVEPDFNFSKKCLCFRVDYCVTQNIQVLEDVLEMKNLNAIVLTASVTLKKPFYIQIDGNLVNKTYITFDELETKRIHVIFEPNTETKHSYKVKDIMEFRYQKHTKKDIVKLTGEVNYPNLDFVPNKVMFGPVAPGCYSCCTVEVRNVSPIAITYLLEWSGDSLVTDVPILEDYVYDEETVLDYTESSQPTIEIIEPEILTPESKKGKKGKDKKDKKDKGKKDKDKKSKKGSDKSSSKKDKKKEKSDKSSKKSGKSKDGKKKKTIPVEFIFQHYYTETYLWPNYIQIYEHLIGPISRASLIGLSQETKNNLTKMKQVLLPLVCDQEPCTTLIKCMDQEPAEEIELDSVLNVIPTYGFLEPLESQKLYFSFYPKKHTRLSTSVLCHILGGPTEIIPITGLSSDIHYEIDSTYVNFGRQVFSLIVERKITLSNKGYVPFTFRINSKYVTGSKSIQFMEAGSLTMHPMSGEIYPLSEFDIMLRYYPGIAGKFLETFEIEIEHLAPIVITATAYGIFPQVYMTMPRPSLMYVDSNICCKAVASLQPDYLATVDYVKLMKESVEIFVCELPKSEKRKLQRDGWSIVVPKNYFPSAMDIELAIERVIVYKEISLNSGILLRKQFGVVTPPYLMDFGIVVTDNIAHYTAMIVNYSPIEVRVRIATPSHQKAVFIEAGFDIQFNTTTIKVGDSVPLYILFAPKSDVYPDRYYEIDQILTIEVLNGIKMPIEIRSIVTKPFLETSSICLHFRKVNCGNLKSKNFIMSNTSLVPCKWKAHTEIKETGKRCNPFKLTLCEGILNPGEEMLFDVQFEPCKRRQFRGLLVIQVEDNDEIFCVTLYGEGVKPHLIIDRCTLQFTPSVPYSNTSVQNFSIENRCDFPIEYFFTDFDKTIINEDKVKCALMEYYMTDKLLIPERKAGEGLPPEFYEFCEEICFGIPKSSVNVNLSSRGRRTKKKNKVEEFFDLDVSPRSVKSSVLPSFYDKTFEEIQSLVQNFLHMKTARSEHGPLSGILEDPVKLAFANAKIKIEGEPEKIKPEHKLREGICFVFYGAPFVEVAYPANRIARMLNLPAYNLDDIIIEALIYSNDLSALKINELIHNAYIVAGGTEAEKDPDIQENPFDVLKEKVAVLVENKKIGSATARTDSSKSSKSTKKDKASKKSSKSSKGSKKEKGLFNNARTLIAMPEDLIVDLLKRKLRDYTTGVVIETLQNSFIREPMLAFKSILMACGNLRYVHLFIMYKTFEDFEHEEDTKQRNAELDRVLKIENLLESFDSMTDEEFSRLTSDEKHLYKTVYLAERKAQTKRRMEALKARLVKSKKKGGRRKDNLKTNSAATRSKKTASPAPTTIKSRRTSAESKTTNKSSKKKKLPAALVPIKKSFDEFQNHFDEILHFSEYWDKRTQQLTKPYSPKQKSKEKGKKSASKKESKKPIKTSCLIVKADVIICTSPLGFPLSIIHKVEDIEGIPIAIQCHQNYEDACYTLQESFKEVLIPSEETYTVIHKPYDEREQNAYEEFDIKNIVEAQHSIPEFMVNALTPDDYGNDEKLIESCTNSSETVNPSVGSELIEIFDERLVINPGEIKYYSIRFCSKNLGNYSTNYKIELTNWSSVYTIECSAQCDMPRISASPNVMFPYVLYKKNLENMYMRNVYIKESDTFDLGYKLVCAGCDPEVIEQRFLTDLSSINLCNISTVFCDIKIHLVGNPEVFKVSSATVLVAPDHEELLRISACPLLMGSNTAFVALSIKDNPQVEIINTECWGCTFEFEISTKKVIFERALLTVSEKKMVRLCNKSSVPIIWRCLNADVVAKNFLVEPENCYMRPNDIIQVSVLYLAAQVEIVNTKLFFEIYNDTCLGKPLMEDYIELLAETCDLLVDCTTDINFGEIKARKDYPYEYTFLNRGKYSIQYKFVELIPEVLTKQQKRVRKMFKIESMHGTLSPNKITAIHVVFNSSKTIHIRKMPIIQCSLIDEKKKTTLSSFIITATAKTLYSEYVVYPTPELNFGTMLVKTASTQKMTITNTGKVPFNYTVLCRKTLEALQSKLAKGKGKKEKGGSKGSKSSKSSAKSSKKSKESGGSKKTKDSKDSKKTKASSKASKKTKGSSKGGQKEKLGPPISCGSFICKNSQNTIQPQAQATLEVECNMKDVGLQEEILIIFVSECGPKDKLGTIVEVKADGCLPSVDFEDYDKIFRNHFVVGNIEEFIKPKELDTFCVFAKDTKTLTFNNVCINTKVAEDINLFNNSRVDAEVNLRIPTSTAFVIKTNKLFIPPFSQRSVTIEFTPQELKLYQSNLELFTVLPVGYKLEIKTFGLCGTGCVPNVTLKEPKFPIKDMENEIKFDPVLIDEYRQKLISLENTGTLPCKVIVEIAEDNDEVFSLIIKEDTVGFLNCIDTVNSTHVHMLKFIPGEIGNMYVKYEPKSVLKSTCVVNIHTINNPYDNISIKVQGESFMEEVILENLPTSTSKIESNADLQITNHYGSSYIIDFDQIPLNLLQKTKFKIINRSDKEIFKFIFRTPTPEIVFIPAIGHLKPKAYKDVIVTFVSEFSVRYTKLFMDCLLCKIIYTEFVDTPMSWDDRQTLVIWEDPEETEMYEDIIESEQRKILDEIPEPMYDIVEDSIQRIPIYFSVVADYTSYALNAERFLFRDTFLFDKRQLSFIIENTSDVYLEIKWEIILDNSCIKMSTVKKEDNYSARPVTPAYCMGKNSKPRPLTGHENFVGTKKSISNVSSITEIEPETYNPFKVNPQCIKIPPRGTHNVSLTFAPVDVFEYKAILKGNVPNLTPEQKDICVQLVAKSMLPCCHFEVQLSDYISSGRRKLRECDPVVEDTNLKVVEFNCLGVDMRHNKIINIRNPAEDELAFSWHKIKSYEIATIPLFECSTPKGTIESEKVLPVTFSILPKSTGTFEAFYEFKIKKYDIIIPFLFVANVHESNVRFLSSHLTLKPAVLGICVSDNVVLKNYEDIDLRFRFKKSSLYSEGRKQCLAVDPIKGILPKNGEVKLKISYSPNDIGEELFSLRCLVDLAKNPLILPVTTNCYEAQPVVFSYLFGRKSVLQTDINNVFDLGHMMPNHLVSLPFCIRNEGNIGFYYIWKINDEYISRRFNIEMSYMEGYIKTNNEVNSVLSVTPIRPSLLKNFKLELQIKYGPTFKILLNGSSANSPFKFSFIEHDFGPCMIQTSNECYHYKVLEFYNAGMAPLTLECNFVNTYYLTISHTTGMIGPKSRQLIYICFYPRKAKKYYIELIFTINREQQAIKIIGEGINLDMHVVNIDDRHINLGSPQIGEIVERTITVMNRSPTTVQAYFDIWDRLPIITNPIPIAPPNLVIPEKIKIIEDEKVSTAKGKKKDKKDKKKKGGSKGKSSKSTKSSKGKSEKSSKGKSDKSSKKSSKKSKGSSKKSAKSGKTTLIEDVIQLESPEEILRKKIKTMVTISPKTPVTIPSNRTAEFTIIYTPNERIKTFTEKISAQVLELVVPLCMVKGSCIGPDFYFNRDDISFGVVVLHCIREIKLVLCNDGNISSKFQWICDDVNFTIIPMEGYSTAGLPVTFVVKYHPYEKDIQTKYKAQCILESCNKKLEIMLIGMCADLPPPTSTINFSCAVRNTDKKMVAIQNPTGYVWKLYPSVTGDYFTCCEYIEVKPKSQTQCEIFYEPLVMTKTDPHQGFIFVKIPNGEALVYGLHGEAKRPEPIATKVFEFPAKTQQVLTFTVRNWLNYTQDFKVYTEDITKDNAVNLYEVKGLKSIEILGKADKEYEWYFYAYKECSLEFRIIFMNAMSEYVFYHLQIKIVKTIPLETIELSTCVRTSVIHELKLINPLKTAITYKITCNCQYVTFQNMVPVEPNSEVPVNIEYNPLHIGTCKGNLEANCQELGSYLYTIELTALTPPPEPTVHFRTVFGESQTKSLELKSFAKSKTTFNTQVLLNYAVFKSGPPLLSNPDSFFVAPSISVNPGQTTNFNVTFNPYFIGKTEGIIAAFSEIAGEYKFPLVGTCTPPVPKGPYILQPQKTVTVNFLNPYLSDETFICITEPLNIFLLNSNELFLNSRSSGKVELTLNEAVLKNVTGKLTIYPKNITGSARWVYYLQSKV